MAAGRSESRQHLQRIGQRVAINPAEDLIEGENTWADSSRGSAVVARYQSSLLPCRGDTVSNYRRKPGKTNKRDLAYSVMVTAYSPAQSPMSQVLILTRIMTCVLLLSQVGVRDLTVILLPVPVLLSEYQRIIQD